MNEFDNLSSTEGTDDTGENTGAAVNNDESAVSTDATETSAVDGTSVGAADKDSSAEGVFSEDDTSSGVVFEADGTYHGSNAAFNDTSDTETSTASSPYQGNNGTYPYGAAPGTYGYNPNMSYGRTNPNGAYTPPQSPNPGAPYQAPHRPNQNAPYGAPQGTNPNGQYQAPGEQGGYPYGNSGNQSGNGYRPPVEPYRYAYPDNSSSGNKKKGSMKIFAVIAAVLFVFIVIALIAVITGGTVASEENSTTDTVSENVEEFVTNASPETDEVNSVGEMNPKSIYSKVLPSSVGILVYDRSKTLASEGTGVLFSESIDGEYTYIVTCAHVISGTTGVISVQLHDGKKYDADVVGFDSRTDIGVLRIKESGLTLAEVGDSSKIYVGDPIYAIGNPGGVEFANSFTNGMVSALDRPVNSSDTGYTTECIQHTAAINPGNSGGALVNSFGQVVGINSMKIVADDYEGMGFAVPSSVFVDVVNEILKNGYVSNRPKLGITYVPASEYSSYGMFVAIKGLPSGAIVIYEIAEDSALKGTEAMAGDMIIAVNGKPLDDASYLSEVIENANVGDKLKLTLVRIHDDYSSEEFEVTATLVEDRGNTVVTEPETQEQFPGSDGGYEDYYGDYFEKYFEDFFNDRFGGFAP